jgi:hypothetical protein
MKLMTVDPGKNLGWAMFEDGRLIETGLIEAHSLADTVFELVGVCERHRPAEAVIEIPQVYQQRLWKGDQNDLVDVAVIAGAAAATLIAYAEPQLIRPHGWKGNRPKAIDNRHTFSLLDDEEKSKIPSGAKRHNVLDAVGMGLWKLGRRKPWRS